MQIRTRPLSRLHPRVATACALLALILLPGSPTSANAQQAPQDSPHTASVPAAASAAFVPLPADIDCSVQGLDVVEGPTAWVAKSAAGLSCTMRGLAGTKTVDFVSGTLTNGTASTKDFGEVRLIVHGVPRGGGTQLSNGGRISEVVYPLSGPDPGLVTITLGADRVSALRDYLAVPTPFEASVASCSARVAAAWPPDIRSKKPESIWRIVDLAGCNVYYARLIDLGLHCRAGMMLTFNGKVTLTLDPSRPQAAHVTSIDPWKPPIAIPGTKSNINGSVTGMAALLGNPDGTVRQEQPELQGGQGFDYVTFKDLRNKQKLFFPKFIADTVETDQAAAPPLKD